MMLCLIRNLLRFATCAAAWSALALGVAADDSARKPATPGEINSGLGLSAFDPKITAAPNGRWATLATSKGYAYLDLESGKKFDARENWSAWISTWAPASSTLAVQVRREGKYALTLWTPDNDTERELLVFPRRLEFSNPVWSADGKTVFIRAHLDLPWQKSRPADDNPPGESPNVTIRVTAPYLDSTAYQRFWKQYTDAYAEGKRSLLLAIDVASGACRLVCKGNDLDSFYPSPDGKWIALVQAKFVVPGRETNLTGQVLSDIYLIPLPKFEELGPIDLENYEERVAGWTDLAGNQIDPILRDVLLNDTSSWIPIQGNNGNPVLVWSPDSSAFAYATTGRKATGDVFVWRLAAHAETNLTRTLSPLDPGKDFGYGKNYTFKYSSPKFGNLFPSLWLPDGKALVAVGRDDAWLIPVSGMDAPRVLTKTVPAQILRVVAAPGGGDRALVDGSGNLFVLAKDPQTRLDSIWRVNIAMGEVARIADTGLWINLYAYGVGNASKLIFSAHSEFSADNVYALPLTGAAQPINFTQFKPELPGRLFPETRVLAWTTPAGAKAHGLLHLPAGASPEQKVPLLVNVTPGWFESRIDARLRSGAAFLQDQLASSLHDGIAVLDPDVPMSDLGVYDHPLKQVVDAVLGGTDAAAATGVIDEGKLGLVGDKYGGFAVQAVIGQTDRFKAAASIDGISNWSADYVSSSFRYVFEEAEAPRMGQPLWLDPARYAEDSPISYFDHTHTPLLLVHGERAAYANVAQSRQSFFALERLQRTVVFAVGHRDLFGPSPEQLLRVRAWFRERLTGAKPMAHIARLPSFFFGGSEDFPPDADSPSTQPKRP